MQPFSGTGYISSALALTHPACIRRWNTCSTLHTCSSKCFPMMRISSIYTRHVSQCNPVNTRVIRRWKILGEFASPKLRTLKRNCPFVVTKAVLSASLGSMVTCQNKNLQFHRRKVDRLPQRIETSIAPGQGERILTGEII